MNRQFKSSLLYFLMGTVLVLASCNLTTMLDKKHDLQLIYQADLSSVSPDKEKETIADVISILKNRLAPLDTNLPNIRWDGHDQIVIELTMPKGGFTDAQKERIGRMTLLEFRELVQTLDDKGNVTEEKWIPATGTYNKETKVLNSSYLNRNTEIRIGSRGEIELYFEWNEEGSALFKEITTRLLYKPLGIYEGSGDDALPLLGEDGEPIAPIVQAVLTTDCVITGLSRTEAIELSKQLNAGRLPVPLKLIGEKLLK